MTLPITLPAATSHVPRIAFRRGMALPGTRTIPEETPVALTYNHTTYAVMLASPADLEDFAVGFSLTEGIVHDAAEIEDLSVVAVADGIEARMWLSPDAAGRADARRRRIAGPSGCGLCGIESLAEAVRALSPIVSTACFDTDSVAAAMASLPPAQTLNEQTHAVHAAAFWHPAHGLVALREDVGRHNALDKLVGAMARAGTKSGDGLLVLSSRVSVELVQKTAVLGAPVMVAVSAPTSLALRMAEAAGITLIGVARADGYEIFTHPERIVPHKVQDVA